MGKVILSFRNDIDSITIEYKSIQYTSGWIHIQYEYEKRSYPTDILTEVAEQPYRRF
jgi:hypothetical protein